MKIILASNSPRRKELLKKIGVDFSVIPSSVEEIVPENISIENHAEYLAKLKALDVFSKTGNVVLGADTIVVLDNLILGKPKDSEDAFNTLKLLSSKTHYVYTGYCVVFEDKIITGSEKTAVTFNNLSDDIINAYVKSGLCLDKAGSYGIQDGFPLVKSIEGDYDNVIGLPTNKIKKILTELL